jgi:hypothetical protein
MKESAMIALSYVTFHAVETIDEVMGLALDSARPAEDSKKESELA